MTHRPEEREIWTGEGTHPYDFFITDIQVSIITAGYFIPFPPLPLAVIFFWL